MSTSGPSVVITFNGGPTGGGYVSSQNGGVTFGAMTSPTRPAGSNPCCDTGIASDFIGRFYYLELYRDDGSGNCTNSIHVSTDGGQTFGGIVGSPFSYGPGTDFPDQPHVAIDRVNLVGGNPQLYVTTRHFTSGINCPQTGGGGTVQGEVVCSTNGGAAWTAPIVLAPFTDTMHMGTGSDGSVYLVGNGSGGTILLRRSPTSCNGGLAFGAAVTVASGRTYGPVGIDREFPQPYVAVDRVSPNVAYVAWSSDRIAGDNDRDIFLARCTFSGSAGVCEAPVRINDDAIGSGNDQYFQMLCVDPNNQVILSWNDQRAGSNSTAIYHAEVDPSGAALAVGTNYVISDVNFTPQNFGGTPDYGDYNENVDACDGNHFYAAWVSHVSPPGITPASNDPDIFFTVVNNLQDVRVSGPLDFGDVCLGTPATRELHVYNVGDATLTLSSVVRTSGSPNFSVDPSPTTPLTIGPGAHADFTIRYTPSSIGSKSATIRITSNDPDQPTIDLTATANTPAPDIRVTGSTALGQVCAGNIGESKISVCNTGSCDLHVTSVAFDPPCPDFTIANNPFPATVSHDACVDVTIRFTPTSPGTKTCTLKIDSDDPDTPSIVLTVTAGTPVASIDVPPDVTFPPTVIASVGSCPSLKPFPISNTGACNLRITNIALSGTNASEYSFVGLPSFPIILEPGHVVGEGNLKIAFRPTVVARNRTAQVTVTYVADPVAGTTASVVRAVCGEGVKTGARVLVVAGGVPVSNVDQLKLQRINANRKVTNEVVMKVALQNQSATAPCASFAFHREYGGVTNPIQLLPGSYQLTATTKTGNTYRTKTVFFDLQTCSFNQNIVIDMNTALAAATINPEGGGSIEPASQATMLNPQTTRLVGMRPNPFGLTATLAFDLARSEQVSLRIYDVRGVLVRDLLEGTRPAGRHEVVWDGRDRRGIASPNGIFFVQFGAGSQQERKKVILIR